MSQKVEIKGSYLLVTDTVNSQTWELPAKDFRYAVNGESIMFIDSIKKLEQRQIAFSDIVDSGGLAFGSVQLLLDFFREFTGFNTASGSSGVGLWKDNIMPFSAAKGNGTTEPIWSDIGNGIYKMKFTAADELFVSFHVNHDYKKGTDAFPHVHWFSDAIQGVGDVTIWEISYIIGIGHQQGGSLTGALTSFNVTHTADGTEAAGDHIITECSIAQAFDLVEPDSVILMGVKLVSTTTAGNIFGIMADLHYESDRDGTINKAPNFYV